MRLPSLAIRRAEFKTALLPDRRDGATAETTFCYRLHNWTTNLTSRAQSWFYGMDLNAVPCIHGTGAAKGFPSGTALS
jgi:hypothetical protein